MNRSSFWEEPEKVEMFANRDADTRMMELLKTYSDPAGTRVLDLGCAGGRNTVVLAEQGFDFFAVDSSEAMVQKTRERVAAVMDRQEADKRVTVGRMEDLGRFPSRSFDLILAFGIYHNAATQEQWDQALTESARVLRSGGQVLVANFGPRSNPTGRGLTPVAGAPHVYEGFGPGRLYLLEPDELDREMAGHGLLPVTPTTSVKKATDEGYRVTVNGHYAKR